MACAMRLWMGLLCMPMLGAADPLPRDPTLAPQVRMPASKTVTPGDAPNAKPPVLTLITVRSRDSRAWIDDKPLRVGDSVGDARVVAIDAKGVTLLREGVRERLLLVPAVHLQSPRRKPSAAAISPSSGPAQ